MSNLTILRELICCSDGKIIKENLEGKLYIDLNDVDDPKNLLNSEIHQELHQREFLSIIQDNIKKQYERFEDLGQNILKMFENELREGDKTQLFTELIVYTSNNLIPIVDLDNLSGDRQRLLMAGEYIYEFICVDCFSSLIPALMESLGITSVDEIDGLINLKYMISPAKFKTDFLTTITMTIEQLMKLQSITPEVKKDHNYQKLLGKYYYVKDLVELGDTTMFLNNFIRPVISKYNSDFIWKLL